MWPFSNSQKKSVRPYMQVYKVLMKNYKIRSQFLSAVEKTVNSMKHERHSSETDKLLRALALHFGLFSQLEKELAIEKKALALFRKEEHKVLSSLESANPKYAELHAKLKRILTDFEDLLESMDERIELEERFIKFQAHVVYVELVKAWQYEVHLLNRLESELSELVPRYNEMLRDLSVSIATIGVGAGFAFSYAAGIMSAPEPEVGYALIGLNVLVLVRVLKKHFVDDEDIQGMRTLDDFVRHPELS